MINMKPHCLAVQSVLGEQHGDQFGGGNMCLMLCFEWSWQENITCLCRAWVHHLGPEQNYGPGRGKQRSPWMLGVEVGRSITWSWFSLIQLGCVPSQNGFGTQTCHFQAMWNLASELVSLIFRFLSFLMIIVTPVSIVNIEWDFWMCTCLDEKQPFLSVVI